MLEFLGLRSYIWTSWASRHWQSLQRSPPNRAPEAMLKVAKTKVKTLSCSKLMPVYWVYWGVERHVHFAIAISDTLKFTLASSCYPKIFQVEPSTSKPSVAHRFTKARRDPWPAKRARPSSNDLLSGTMDEDICIIFSVVLTVKLHQKGDSIDVSDVSIEPCESKVSKAKIDPNLYSSAKGKLLGRLGWSL